MKNEIWRWLMVAAVVVGAAAGTHLYDSAYGGCGCGESCPMGGDCGNPCPCGH
jgi:hypothetical protein